jgi:hypothetical protein
MFKKNITFIIEIINKVNVVTRDNWTKTLSLVYASILSKKAQRCKGSDVRDQVFLVPVPIDFFSVVPAPVPVFFPTIPFKLAYFPVISVILSIIKSDVVLVSQSITLFHSDGKRHLANNWAIVVSTISSNSISAKND